MTLKQRLLIPTSCILAMSLLSGCAIADNSPQPSDSQISIHQPQANNSRDFGYLYNRNNNLEYMDVKSIEKLKKAVSLLIDKVDAMEKKQNITQEVRVEVDKKTSQIHSEISALKEQIGAMAQSGIAIDEAVVRVNESYSEDDMKILQFIEGKSK